MRCLICILLVLNAFLHLSGQDSSGIKIYGTYRVPDEISLGVSYDYRSLFGFSIEGGYNIGFRQVLDINGTKFNFEDFYALPEADRGLFCRIGSNIYTRNSDFVSVSFLLKKGRVPVAYLPSFHGNPSEKAHMEYLEYGLDVNYNQHLPGIMLFGGVGYRYGIFELDVYELDREPVVRSREQKKSFPCP